MPDTMAYRHNRRYQDNIDEIVGEDPVVLLTKGLKAFDTTFENNHRSPLALITAYLTDRVS